jgi:hypothetical protein
MVLFLHAGKCAQGVVTKTGTDGIPQFGVTSAENKNMLHIF